MAEGAQCAADLPLPAREICVFEGRDGAFELYDDAGDGMAYLDGGYIRIPMRYEDSAGVLALGASEGNIGADCDMKIRFIRKDGGQDVRTIRYRGAALHVPLRG